MLKKIAKRNNTLPKKKTLCAYMAPCVTNFHARKVLFVGKYNIMMEKYEKHQKKRKTYCKTG